MWKQRKNNIYIIYSRSKTNLHHAVHVGYIAEPIAWKHRLKRNKKRRKKLEPSFFIHDMLEKHPKLRSIDGGESFRTRSYHDFTGNERPAMEGLFS